MKLLFENWRKYLNEKKFEDYAAEKGAWVELPVTDLQHQDNVDLTKELYDLIATAFAKEPQGHCCQVEQISGARKVIYETRKLDNWSRKK